MAEGSFFDRVIPRADVLSGALTDAMFAANLEQVVNGTADPSYSDPAEFFKASYPSAGMKAALTEVMGRLSGKRADAASLVRLSEALGGGKTHVMIGMYHLATGSLSADAVKDFVDVTVLPDEPIDQVAVMVGTTTGATSFPEVAGISAKTLWGYLALQIGGAAAFDAEVEEADREGVPFGADKLREIMGGRPTLILIDELALYLRTASAKKIQDSTLAKQTTGFLMALIDAVSDDRARTALVVTSTRAEDTFGEETQAVFDAITEAEAVIARKEHAIKPAEEADLPEILASRLFVSIPAEMRESVAVAYADAAREAVAAGGDLADRYQSGAWQAEVERCFPFHPDLIQVFDKRLATIPNFQRTRGALRLLAKTVRLMWETQPANTSLIHLDHIDLADSSLREDLSSRLDRPKWEPVIRRDVASGAGGEPSLAESIDADMGTDYARRLATTIYLWSLTKDAPGVSSSMLFGSVLRPGDDVNVMGRALDRLTTTCWYLHPDRTHGFRFSTEANLNRLLAESMNRITVARIKNRATDIAAKRFKDGSGLKVRLNWIDGSVPDNDQDCSLVVFHWDDFGDAHGVIDTSTPPAQVLQLWEKRPAGGNREFRNRLVFLCPTADTHQSMLDAVREQLAYEDLAASDSLSALSDDQQRQVRDKVKEWELKAAVAVCNHLNLLYYPSSVTAFTAVALPTLTTARVPTNQTEAIFEALDNSGKILRTGSPPIDPGAVKAALGARLDANGLATAELLRFFARRGDMKIVLDKAQVNTLVANGVRRGAWDYFDAALGERGWATNETTPVPTRIADDTYLYPPGTAPTPAASDTPMVDPGPDINWDDHPIPTGPDTFSADGKAGYAITSARDAALAATRAKTTEIKVQVQSIGATAAENLARLLSIRPNPGVAATVTYDFDIGVNLSDTDTTQFCTIGYRGTADDYQPLTNGIKTLLTGRVANLNANVTIGFPTPLDLAGQALEDLVQRCKDTGPDNCTITITTEADT